MSDFESRVRDTLVDRAADAPVGVDLAGGARRRLRRRRTTSVAVAVTAAVAVAVPVGIAALGPSGNGRTGEVATQSPSPTPPSSGWRPETWHHVTFEVPLEWGLGGTTAWCTQADDPAAVTPTVSRPLDVVPMIACSPSNGYGATVGSSAGVLPVEESGAVWQYDADEADEPYYPDGAWLGMWYDDEAVVTVVTQERAETERIMDSIEVVDGVDPYGCPPTLGDAEAATSDGSDSVSVCRYDEEDLLSASRRYSGEQAAALITAIEQAPHKGGIQRCTTETPVPRYAVLQGGAYLASIVSYDPCQNGVYLSGVVKELTDDVVQWLYPFPR